MEFNPEVFAQVTMLYVDMDVGTSQCPQVVSAGLSLPLCGAYR